MNGGMGQTRSRGWWAALRHQPTAFQVSFSFAKGSTKLSHDLKITRNTHIWGSVCLFVLVQSNGVFPVTICFKKKMFNLVGSNGVLITHSLQFRSLNINSPRAPTPSMLLFQLGDCSRYLNNLPFSYMYEKILSTIMQLCLFSEMVKDMGWSHFLNQ